MAETRGRTALVSPTSSGEVIHERHNWLIHQLYVRREYTDCENVIDTQLRESGGKCEYALFVKALIRRHEGRLSESVALLNMAIRVNSRNLTARKQLAQALHLAGRPQHAMELYNEIENIRAKHGMEEDWELPYQVGRIHMLLRNYVDAVRAFMQSLTILRQDCTFFQLGRALVAARDYETACEVYEESLSFSPHNSAVFVVLGELYLKRGEIDKALVYLRRGVALDPSNSDALTTVGCLLQRGGRLNEALDAYNLALARQPESADLWNNVASVFYAQNKLLMAASCLRRCVLADPLDATAQYNLGIVFLSMGRTLSAFQHLSATVVLNKHFGPAFMYLGVALSILNDPDNTRAAYERALSLCSPTDLKRTLLTRVNYAITLFNSGYTDLARVQMNEFYKSVQSKRSDMADLHTMADVLDAAEKIKAILEARAVKTPSTDDQ